MKKYLILAAAILLVASCADAKRKNPETVTLSKEVLMDKIKGAWAGQIIGCTYGGPTEFKYATTINDNIPTKWDEHGIKGY